MKGLEIVSDFEKLQLLSNRHAFRMLKELQKEPMSGVQLAEKLGMKTPRSIYYLKKLEKAGLARQAPRKPEQGYREKCYCAVSQDFLISAGPDGLDEPGSGIHISLSNSYLEYFLERDLDLEEFARVVIEDYMSIQSGEKVVVAFEEQDMSVYIKIITQLRRIGANYRTLVKNSTFDREMLVNLPEKEIRVFYNNIAETVAWSDTWIALQRPAIPDQEGIPQKRIDFITEERRRALSGINEKQEKRAIVISIPRFEERFHTDPDILEKLSTFWKAASVNGDEFSRMRDLAIKIRDLERFSIYTGQDNVLNVHVDRSKFFIDAGPFSSSGNNNMYLIPSGEIAFVPYSSGLSGSIYLDHCELDFTEAKGIHLQVENGIVTDCRIESGDNRLEEYFKTSDRLRKTISQVGFGLNPAARSMSYIPRLDAKVFGSFHLSFGGNLAIGGDVSGYTTWDIITEKPKVTCNNNVIIENGSICI